MFPDSRSRSELVGHSSSYGGAIRIPVAGSTSEEGTAGAEGTGVLDGAGSALGAGSRVTAVDGEGAMGGWFEQPARATTRTSVRARGAAIGG